MKKIIISSIGISGLLLSYAALANVDFDDHDDIAPGADVQNVAVPGADAPVGIEAFEAYQKSLEEARLKGDPTKAGEFTEREVSPSPSPSPNLFLEGVNELPFTLLDASLDRDQDGLSDGDEIKLMTKPNNPDTDSDGYIDGLEVIRQYNPLIAGPNDRIEYIEPNGRASTQYKITGIRLTGYNEDEKITVTGVGPNNGLVAVLLYSTENTVWITRTDKTGRFIYVSDRTLDLGEYKAYASSVSANGLPLAFSKPLEFEKTADALIKKEVPSPKAEISNDEKERNMDTFTIAVGAGGVITVLIVMILIWMIRRRKKIQPKVY